MERSFRVVSLLPGVLLAGYPEEQLLIGGGYSPKQLNIILEELHPTISGILIPNEYGFRKDGLYEMSVQWQIPLFGHWKILFPMLLNDPHHIPPRIFSDFEAERDERQCGMFRISTFPVSFPSMKPYGWIFSCGNDRIAVMLDGSLTDQSAEKLRQCTGMVSANCRDVYPERKMDPGNIMEYYPLLEEQEQQLADWEIQLPQHSIQLLETETTGVLQGKI